MTEDGVNAYDFFLDPLPTMARQHAGEVLKLQTSHLGRSAWNQGPGISD